MTRKTLLAAISTVGLTAAALLSAPAAHADSSLYNDLVLSDSPTGYWKLDEESFSGAITNSGSAGSDADGIATDATSSTDVRVFGSTRSGQFTPNSSIEVPFNAALNPGAFTAELWARVDGGQGTYRSPLVSRDVFPTRGFTFYASPSNRWEFWIGNGVDTGWNVITGPAVTLGAWTHLVGQYDGSSMKLYVNGNLIGSTAASYAVNTARNLRIGGGASEGPGDFFFNGLVDEVAIYPSVLSASRVAEGYATGIATTPTLGSVSVSGLARPGRTLTGNVTGVDGTPSYQWQSRTGGAWSDIDGATAETLVVPADLAGKRVRLQVAVSGGAGSITGSSPARRVGTPLPVSKSGGQKPAGHRCTQRGTSGADDLSVSVASNRTAVVCAYGSDDTVTINSVGNDSRLVIVKGPGSLNVVWNAGSGTQGDTVGQGAVTIVRPPATTVTGAHGANPNTDADGSTALCMTNGAYARAADLDALEAAIEGTMNWFTDGSSASVDDTC